MAKLTIALNTSPHVADIGGVELLFQPEVIGTDFIDAYADVRALLAQLGGNGQTTDPDELRAADVEMRRFLARLMLPESAEVFFRWEVVAAGKVVSVHTSPEAAKDAAAQKKNATVRDAGMRLPMRALIELIEWVPGLYGGGRPPTSSSDSATASSPGGTRGTGTSRSAASTRTRGR
ncbi:hypothetical protein [Streptomyces sp. DH12]|uniref:hypothetical protein n=1 Tax=Streptomyces sp. DH12 TaxID=2857010 RepID=UPI001E59A438|nr:hypothetical protein [Streptomyces sp. DH12]